MGVLSCIAGCVIVLINVVFLILGLVFTALGVVLKFGAPWVSQYIQPILKGVLDALQDNFKDIKIDINAILNNVFEIAASLAIILIVLGIFLLILSITGMCGVCCSSKILLSVFCVITGILFIAVLAITIWTYKSDNAMATLFKAPLENMVKKYKGAGSFDVNTLVIDLLNMFLGCCGINNGTDFDKVKWNKNFNYTFNGEKISFELVYPLSCCKLDSSQKPIDANCTFDPMLNTSNYNIGCWGKLTGGYLGYFSYLNFALFGACGLFAVLLALGLLAICCDKDNKVRDSV